MKPQVLLVALAVLSALAALPLAESKGHGVGQAQRAKDATTAGAWPCCDSCGSCTRSIPPLCQCLDTAPTGCNPACKNCVKSSGLGGGDAFRCMDRVANLCKRRCTPAA
ncbi:hypothetical protein BS78_03G335500 [Paspalum vaginatum]|nr:hypothetical protein BS78_03G335500 [Paspalum vaginatum]